jgi:two-component system, OmpR family, phosphate regulon sensor histidine kinase PhoR
MRLEFLQTHAWQVSVGRFVVLVAAAIVVGLLIHQPLYTLLVALFGYSLWSLISLYQIQSWLRSRQRRPPPEDRGVWSDISTQMYTKLHTERSRKRRLINLLRAFREGAAALPDGVVVLTTGRSVLWFNEAASRLLGLTAPRDRGAHIDSFLPAQAKTWIENDPASEVLREVAAAHNESVRLSFRLIPYSHEHILLVVRDVTPLARLEQVRRDFVANVSHELRTPLTVLHGYLEMLEPEVMPQLAPILADLRGQSRRMTQIVEDLLTLSRLEAQQTVSEERVSMRALLSTLKREADGLSHGRHNVTLLRTCELDLRGSTDYLHSAFSNLVTNAVRYTPEGGRIEISWQSTADGGARFAVADTGYGIPAEHLPRITERFYRVSTSRSRETGGTGLGLSIVKHVLQLHQAQLTIDSEVGVGSTFACVFGAERLLAPESMSEDV